MENNFDTIVAIITPMAMSAVGIIRISGENAYKIASEIFSKPIKPKMINYGYIKDNDSILDEVILLPFVAPHSYSGEDVIEIQTHGSVTIINSILELILSKGARLALKGEFTKRAFLNHRIDLSQAEAVMDVIQARSIKAAKSSVSNLGGYLKNKINSIKENLTDLYSKLMASIDFPEDVKEIDKKEVVSICNDNILEIKNILNNSKSHNYIRDGISVCLIGRPNVGKSSLFNALLNYNRAIVTDIAGTTRDTIKETLNLGGYFINFVDTAGIRDKNKADAVEKIGIDNSIDAIEQSDIVLFLFEQNIKEIDEKLLNLAKDKKKLFVQTKVDINYVASIDNDNIIKTSSVTSSGIKELKQAILEIIKSFIPEDSNYTTNKRQQACLLKSLNSLEQVVITANSGMYMEECADLYTLDLKQAILELGEITGEVLTDNILDKVFDAFCIGK